VFGITTAQVRGVRFGNGKFVLSGSPGLLSTVTLATTVDGTSATAVASGLVTVSGYSSVYSSDYSTWIAVAAGTNSIVYSFDNAVTWTGNGLGVLTTLGYGVACRYSNSTL
jgi:hypothetical protein